MRDRNWEEEREFGDHGVVDIGLRSISRYRASLLKEDDSVSLTGGSEVSKVGLCRRNVEKATVGRVESV
jgi:hypothetical protein